MRRYGNHELGMCLQYAVHHSFQWVPPFAFHAPFHCYHFGLSGPFDAWARSAVCECKRFSRQRGSER